MTVKLYHLDSYQQIFSAKVTQLDAEIHGFFLDQTVFFPGGGGQPGDKGVVQFLGNTFPVVKVELVNREPIHILSPDIPLLQEGSIIEGSLDWEHRYQLMRTHTAMHILCGVIFRDYGASVTGGNMTPLKGRMDFEFASLQKDLVRIIEDAVNLEIRNSRPVSWRSIPRDEAFKIPDLIRTKINLLPEYIEEIRVVEIDGLDLQADGGTHVKNTSEVGNVIITDYKSKGKNNKRIYLDLIS